MGARSRKWYRYVVASGAIAELITMPYNAEILQLACRFGEDGDPPTTALQLFYFFRRTPGGGPTLAVNFIKTDVSETPTQDLVCSGNGWQAKKDDVLGISYANPDNLDVEIDICIKEGD